MVLKNSKWDKKAKFQYMKKHGLTSGPKKPSQPLQKWSSKDKPVEVDDEWDSDNDEQLLNHFYPLIGEDNLTRDQKIKIKQQILQELQEKLENDGAIDDETNAHEANGDDLADEIDGIYLGPVTDKPAPEESASGDKFDLQEYLDNIDRGNRKLLSNKMTTNFLEEYGLQSYAEITRTDDDYDIGAAKQQRRDIKNVPTNELDGFVIGESQVSTPRIDTIRQLTAEEMQQEAARRELDEKNRFLQQIKRKFADQASAPKVLEINNFNNNDEQQVSRLNEKLVREDDTHRNSTLDDDLDTLLGASKPRSADDYNDTSASTPSNLDELMSNLNLVPLAPSQPQKSSHTTTKPCQLLASNNDQDFLDSIL